MHSSSSTSIILLEHLCRNVFQSLSAANMKLQHPNESNQVDIFQRYSLFSAKVPLFVTILPPQLNRETLSKEFVLKTLTLEDSHSFGC